VVMRAGIIEQVGAPLELYNNPRNLFVATFLGQPPTNIVEATVEQSTSEALILQVGDGGRLVLPTIGDALKAGERIRIGIRPEGFAIGSGPGSVPVSIDLVEQLGNETQIYCRLNDGQALTLNIAGQINPPAGSTLDLQISPEQIMVFDAEDRNLRYSANQKG